LNFELFIARKTFFDKENQSRFTRPIINIAIAGITLSLTIMLISVGILDGYKKEITNKVTGFSNHIHIVNYDSNSSFETKSIPKNLVFLPAIDSIPGVKYIQSFAVKAGIIRHNESNLGAVVKGIGNDFKWDDFRQYIVEGESFVVTTGKKTNKTLVSKRIANKLDLNVGDKFNMFFIDGYSNMRIRRFTVSGIYSTMLEDIDDRFIIADIGHVQKLYGWETDRVSGFEIKLDDFEYVDYYTELIEDMVSYEFLEDNSRLKVESIKEKFYNMFDWLKLMNMNEAIIMALTLTVAGFNMISGLLILILDRTKMIGILKALGAENWSVRKVFLYQSSFILGKGLLWGNIMALTLSLIQKYTGIIKLNEANYYISEVPIDLSVLNFATINIATIAVVLIILTIPSLVIAKISPEKTMKYE